MINKLTNTRIKISKKKWEHFDVNKNNYLDFADMPAFEKYLASEKSFDLDALVLKKNDF